MTTGDFPILSGNLAAALDRAHEATSTDLPHDRILRFEDAFRRPEGDEHDRYRWLQRCTGLRGLFRYVVCDGLDPHLIVRRLFAVGQHHRISAFGLTDHERAKMNTDNAASVRWRQSLIYDAAMCREIELAVAAFEQRSDYRTREDIRLDDMLSKISDGLEFPPGEDEKIMRREAVVIVMEFLAAGIRPAAPIEERARRAMRELWTLGRGFHQEPFASMTMDEAGKMLAETKSNHSHRAKKHSRLIERRGMNGSRLPRQKQKYASASYRTAAKRTCNRRTGKSSPKPTN